MSGTTPLSSSSFSHSSVTSAGYSAREISNNIKFYHSLRQNGTSLEKVFSNIRNLCRINLSERLFIDIVNELVPGKDIAGLSSGTSVEKIIRGELKPSNQEALDRNLNDEYVLAIHLLSESLGFGLGRPGKPSFYRPLNITYESLKNNRRSSSSELAQNLTKERPTL